jgi:hypothetical protein
MKQVLMLSRTIYATSLFFFCWKGSLSLHNSDKSSFLRDLLHQTREKDNVYNRAVAKSLLVSAAELFFKIVCFFSSEKSRQVMLLKSSFLMLHRREMSMYSRGLAAANIRTVHGNEMAERPRLAWSDPRLYGMLLAIVEALMLWTVSSTMDTVWTLMLSSCLAVWLHP